MSQVGLNLTDCFDGFPVGKRCLIHDRDPLHTAQFTNTLAAADVRCIKLPPESPNLNAYAERVVRSIKSECLDRMNFFGGKHLQCMVHEYVEHYHAEPNHQGIETASSRRRRSRHKMTARSCHDRASAECQSTTTDLPREGVIRIVWPSPPHDQSCRPNRPSKAAVYRLGELSGR